MKISKNELIQLLSVHLGSDEASISSQLDKLIADIQKATNKGEKFSINGFGDFDIKNGYLTFSIAPIFASEINYNYEGLMPVDIDKPDILLPTESLDEGLDRPDVKTTNIVIVDEDVDGEEDPFEGLQDESTIEIVVEDDTTDEVDSKVDEIDEAPFEIDDKVEETTSVPPKIVSADVEPDELAALEGLKYQGNKPQSGDSLSNEERMDDDPFAGLGEDESILAGDKNASSNDYMESENSADNVSDDLNDSSEDVVETENDEPEEIQEQTNEQNSLEKELGEALKKATADSGISRDPAIISAETSNATPSILDEFFDDDKISDKKEDVMDENGNHTSNETPEPDDIFDLDATQSDEGDLSKQNDESNVHEEVEGGPRIVSKNEAESDDKIAIGKVLAIAALVLIIAMIGGGAWWYLLGPGKSTPVSQPQNVVAQQQPESDNTITNNQQEGIESLQSGESIPLGSADDDSVSSGDEIEESATAQDGGTEVAALSSTEEGQTAQAEIGNVTSSVQEENPIEEQTEEVPPSSNGSESSERTPVANTSDQNAQERQTDSVELASTNTTFGLTGSVVNLSGTVFSIIVHSLPSRQAAQMECDIISQQNFRCLVREANGPQGRRTYRVGIGQFATIDDAQTNISKLPEPFRSRNFIARIN